MAQVLEKSMKEIFHKAQFNKTEHPRYIKKLTKLYNKTDLDTFWKCFVDCLKLPLSMPQQHPYIVNTLEFCAKFSVSSYSSENENMDTMSPLPSKMFEFLLSNHNAKDKAVRFRICHFLNMLLNSMGEHAFIDDKLCDQITVNMMERLMDKSPKVRAQAVFALHRLQDPTDEQCIIIKMYLFHVSKDPQAQVRKAVLATMGKNQKTLQAALHRTRDIDESVRKMAYEFISKVTVRSLSIGQRERLLKDGLKDRSEIVRTYVSDGLLPMWLRYYKGEYISLIHALDAGIGTETATLALEALFKNADVKTLLEQITVDSETKLIPLENLSNENVLYWKCVIRHLQRLSCIEDLESIIPELSKFCKYICEFISYMSKSYEAWEQECHKFVLLQLFEISKTYDLSDEVGRRHLNEVIVDTLMSDHCSDKIIECVVSYLSKVIPDANNMLNVIANIISEIRLPSKEGTVLQENNTDEQQRENNMQKARLRVEMLELEEELYRAVKEEKFLEADSLKEQIKALKEKINQLSEVPVEPVIVDDIREEKNDSATMIKCLNILYTAMRTQTTRILTPTLRSLMTIVLNSLDHPDDNVHILALKTIGLYCIFDKELAKKHIMIFFYQFSLEQENQEIWITALKGIFDLLLIYGLDYFEILQNSQDNSTQNKSEKNRTLYTRDDSVTSITARIPDEESCNFVKILTSLLDNPNQDLRTTAVEGFCKLLLNRRISSNSLISRLIILCYNPVNADDVYLRQCLSAFFDYFVTCVPDAHETLESSYLSTLRVLCNAPDVSPLQEIDVYHVSSFILSLTRGGLQRSDGQTFYTHNNLAFAILAEILNPESKIDQETLIRSLTNLHIQIEDDTSKQNLQEAIENVTKMVTESDKRLMKYIHRFKKRLETPGETLVNAEEEESENETCETH